MGPARGAPFVLLVLGPGASTTHALPAGSELVIGRHRGCDVRIDDPRISRRHAVIRVSAAGEARLADLGSRTGTIARGKRLCGDAAVALTHGTVVVIAGRALIPRRARRSFCPWMEPAAFEARCEAALRAGSSSRVEIALEEERDDAPTVVDVDAAVAADAERLVAVQDVVEALLQPGDAVTTIDAARLDVLVAATRAPTVVERLSSTLAQRGLRASVRCTAPVERATPAPVSAGAAGSTLLARFPTLDRIARGSIPVLLVGESGSGKEVLARAIHARSLRARGRFLAINCAALPESLLEAELFGYERGAFTGAVSAKMGLLEAATGGTLFLDEVGDMPLAAQAKLLRALEEGSVLRVGSVRPYAIDVRVIAATHRDPVADVAEGRFRRDLYYRLAGVCLRVPPLRERREDIPELARELLARACTRAGRSALDLDAGAIAKLCAHAWPGNVRELLNVLEHVALVAAGPIARAEDLCLGDALPSIRDGATAEPHMDERARILDALARCGGNQTKAAALLGFSRRTLTTRLNQLGLPRPRKETGA